MSRGDWVRLTVAKDTYEAQLISGILAEQDIEVEMVRGEGPGAWLTGSEPYWTPVEIMIPGERLEDARAALGEQPNEAPPPVPVHPIEDRYARRKRVMWAIAAVVLAAMLWGILSDMRTLFN